MSGRHDSCVNRNWNIWIVTIASLCLWGTMAHGAGVALNEFMADNQHTITNKEGVTTADWLEIYNGTRAPLISADGT